MHRRSLMIGIGIGIIIGAIMLELFTLGEKSQAQLQEIEQEMNGAVTPAPSEPVMEEIPESLDAETQAEQVEAYDPEVPNEPSPPASTESAEEGGINSPAPLNTPAVMIEPTAEAVPPLSKDQSQQAYIVRIHPFTSLTEAANLLVNHSLIAEGEEFIAYFKDKKDTIRAGFFYIEQNKSMSELHSLFTGTPLTEAQAKVKMNNDDIKLVE